MRRLNIKFGSNEISFGQKDLSAILVVLFYIANMLRMLGYGNTWYFITLFASGIIGWLWFIINHYEKDKIILSVIILGIFTLANVYFIGNSDLMSLANMLLFFGILFCMLQNAMPTIYTLILLLFTMAIFVIAWYSGASSSELLSSSGNYISILLILSACIYYTSVENNKKTIRIWPTIVIFLLCIWAGGRGGILASGILLIGVIVIKFGKKIIEYIGKKQLFFLIILLLAIVIALVFIYLFWGGTISNVFSNTLFRLGRFSVNGLDNSARLAIWGEYLNATFHSFLYFLLGTPSRILKYGIQYSGNVHNSILQLHAYAGIVPFVLLIGLIVRAEIFFLKRRLAVHFLLFNILLLRAMTDKFIFFQYGMPVLLYFVFYKDAFGRKLDNYEYNGVK